MRALLLKELREHRWVLLALWITCGIGLAGFVYTAKDSGSPIVAYRGLVCLLGVLSILTLVNRLVVREYAGRTQLFLETLPVNRLQVIATKWLTGAALLAIPMTIGFAVILHIAFDRVLLNPRFIELMALRSATFLLFAYSLAFLIALTGRYRFVLWGALFLCTYSIDNFAQLPVERWPPFALIAESMAYERIALPLRDLIITNLLAVFLVAATFVLSLASEGALVLALSRKMSPRERVIVTVAVLALVSLLSQIDERKPRPAFTLHDAITSGNGPTRVAIAHADKVSELAAKTLADKMFADLQELQQYLSMSVLPGMFVLPDASIDSDVFLRATLPSSDGVVVRGAVGAEHFDPEAFRAYAIDQALEWYTHGRSQREERRWFSDGFTQWWIARTSAARREQLTERAAQAARMLNLERDPGLERRLRYWLAAREQLGDCLGDALAWRGVALLAQQLGPAGFRQLSTAVLGIRLPNDVRTPLLETSFDDAWRHAAAPAFQGFAADLRAQLLADLGSRAITDTLQPEPVAFQAATMGGGILEVHYGVGANGAAHAPFAVRYAEIGAWQPELERDSLSRVDATRSGVLPRSFQRGTLLFTAIEMRNEHLGCDLRLGARRWELQ